MALARAFMALLLAACLAATGARSDDLPALSASRALLFGATGAHTRGLTLCDMLNTGKISVEEFGIVAKKALEEGKITQTTYDGLKQDVEADGYYDVRSNEHNHRRLWLNGKCPFEWAQEAGDWVQEAVEEASQHVVDLIDEAAAWTVDVAHKFACDNVHMPCQSAKTAARLGLAQIDDVVNAVCDAISSDSNGGALEQLVTQCKESLPTLITEVATEGTRTLVEWLGDSCASDLKEVMHC